MDEITLEIGEKVAQSVQYTQSFRVVTITSRTPGGNYKTSDGLLYYPPEGFVGRDGDWVARQRIGGKWNTNSIFKLTEERKAVIELHAIRGKISKVRDSVSTPTCSLEQAKKLLAAWEGVASVVAEIEASK